MGKVWALFTINKTEQEILLIQTKGKGHSKRVTFILIYILI